MLYIYIHIYIYTNKIPDISFPNFKDDKVFILSSD